MHIQLVIERSRWSNLISVFATEHELARGPYP